MGLVLVAKLFYDVSFVDLYADTEEIGILKFPYNVILKGKGKVKVGIENAQKEIEGMVVIKDNRMSRSEK